MLDWQLNYYAAAMFVTAAISAGLALYIWQRREAPGGLPLAILMAATAEWAFGYALELGSPRLETKLFWSNFNFIGVVTAPTAWLLFTLQYTHRDKWLTRRSVLLLLTPPLVTLALTWTNEAHLLIRSAIRLDTSGAIPMFDPTYAIAFWLYWAYAAAALLGGTVLMIHALVTAPGLYQGQAAALLVAALVPWIGNAIYLSGRSPFPKLDLTPPSFAIAGLLLAWGLFRYRLLDVVPVARDAVIESMDDGVLVLDTQARIVDANPAAERIIGVAVAEAIGRPAAAALARWPELGKHYGALIPVRQQIARQEGDARQDFDLSISPLHDQRKRFTGQLVVFRDITERERLAAALQESYRREQDKRQLSDTLREVAKIVSGTLDRQKVLDLILTQLEKVITYHRATVMLLTGAELGIVAERDRSGRGGNGGHSMTFPVDKYPLNTAVIYTRQPLLLPDVTRDARWQTTSDSTAIRSFINAPLLVQDRPIGILSVGRSDETPYTEDDAQTVFAFASQVAVALEQSRLHEYELKQIEREIEIARQIQVSLLPLAAPRVAGLDIAGFSEPARHVGGDFYNYFIFDDDCLGVAVGDVSGKGMQAALMMALSVGLLTTEVRRESEPAALLAALNRELRPHTQRSKLNTALAYLILKSTEQGWRMRVSNAGVIAPLVRRGDGSMEWMNVGGLPLGTMEKGKEYEELDYALSPGDVLVLSSDGIVEAMNPARELYGFERFTSCVASAPGGSAQAIQDYILNDVRAFVGGAEQHDDITMVVMIIRERSVHR